MREGDVLLDWQNGARLSRNHSRGRKAGHTVGTHTWSHKAIAKLKTFDEGKDEIERGVSAVHRAVGGPIAPFFRFPTLVDTQEAVAYLGKRNIAIFSTTSIVSISSRKRPTISLRR